MTNRKPVIKMGGTSGINGKIKPVIPAPSAEPSPTDLAEAVNDSTLDLDSDPDTSLVGSLSLHALSEHGIGGSLHLDDDALTAAHQQAHRDQGQTHAISDIRFRPKRALDAALKACENAVTAATPM